MRLTSVALLVLCGFLCTGCESLNKTVRNWPHKNPALTEQLAQDQKRREAAEKQLAQTTPQVNDAKAIQKTNFTPSPTAVPGSGDSPLLRAKQAEQARQNQVAKTLYEQVLQQQPENAEAHHRLGVLADQDGRYGEAQQHYQLALQQQPQNASLLSDVGYSFYSQDRLNEAEQYLAQALRIQPENQYARNNLAQVYGRRAQQTGSAADYQLAKEQFTLALGAQGAEQQMQQLFPQPGNERKSLLNPFKKLGQDKTTARNGSNLQAPNPNSKEDGNAQLARQMEEIRAQMQASGELPQKRPQGGPTNNGAGRNPANIPFDQVNSELSRIDSSASQQQAMALRQGYPTPQRGPNAVAQEDWNSANGIEQTGGWDQSNPATGAPSQQLLGDPRMAGQANGFQSSMPNVRSPGGGWEQDGPVIGGQMPNNPIGRPSRGSGNGTADEANSVPGWEQGAGASAMSTTWPDSQGAPTQFDARGQNWDGQSLMSNPGRGSSANPAYEANDPTYYTGRGQSFGTQRPNSQTGARGNGGGQRGSAAPSWDDGRQTAAQLGLDAGMGDMFPGSPGEMDSSGGNNAGNWNNPSAGDPGLNATPTTRRGLPPGGAGNIAPADYRAAPLNYQNTGYSQGVAPAMGENYGNQGGDVTAPWNQQPTRTPRYSDGAVQMQYENDSRQTQGRFAPSRQSSTPQNFGAPPMYYGR